MTEPMTQPMTEPTTDGFFLSIIMPGVAADRTISLGPDLDVDITDDGHVVRVGWTGDPMLSSADIFTEVLRTLPARLHTLGYLAALGDVDDELKDHEDEASELYTRRARAGLDDLAGEAAIRSRAWTAARETVADVRREMHL